MVKQDKEIKDKIMRATIELIKIHGDTSKITVRDIARLRRGGNRLDQLSFSDERQSDQPLYPGINPVFG